jgi:hypothetical protein
MNNCYVCGGKGNLKHLSRDICKKCFARNIERRIKKHLGRSLFKKNDYVLVIGEIEKSLLETSVKGMPIKITLRKRLPLDLKKYNHIIIGKTMDQLDEDFLSDLFNGKLKFKSNFKKMFNILEPITNKELVGYCKIKNMDFKVKENDGLGKKFLTKLKQFEEIKYNLYKNIKELRTVKEKF